MKLTQEGQCGSLVEQITPGGSAAVQAVSCKHFGRSGDTLLHYPARHGHLDIVEYLIKWEWMWRCTTTTTRGEEHVPALEEAAV